MRRLRSEATSRPAVARLVARGIRQRVRRRAAAQSAPYHGTSDTSHSPRTRCSCSAWRSCHRSAPSSCCTRTPRPPCRLPASPPPPPPPSPRAPWQRPMPHCRHRAPSRRQPRSTAGRSRCRPWRLGSQRGSSPKSRAASRTQAAGCCRRARGGAGSPAARRRGSAPRRRAHRWHAS